MTNVVVPPTTLTPDDVLQVVSSGGTALSGNTTFTFVNTGNNVIVLVNGATGAQVQVTIGQTILGQPVTSFTALTVNATTTTILGPFHSALNTPGGNIITVNLTTPTTLSAFNVVLPGVF